LAFWLAGRALISFPNPGGMAVPNHTLARFPILLNLRGKKYLGIAGSENFIHYMPFSSLFQENSLDFDWDESDNLIDFLLGIG